MCQCCEISFVANKDEVLAIAERVVIKADDLLNWCDDSINWTYGLRANNLLTPNVKDEIKIQRNDHDSIKIESADKKENEVQINNNILYSNIRSLKNSKLDFSEIEREKGKYNILYSVTLNNLFSMSNNQKNIMYISFKNQISHSDCSKSNSSMI